MTRYKLTVLLMALILAFSMLVAPAAYADKLNISDIINKTSQEAAAESTGIGGDNSAATANYDKEVYEQGKAILDKAKNTFAYPAPEEYIMIAAKDENGESYYGREIFYVADYYVKGYEAPYIEEDVGVLKDIISFLPGDPLVPVAERDEFYCVYDITNNAACWVYKSMITGNLADTENAGAGNESTNAMYEKIVQDYRKPLLSDATNEFEQPKYEEYIQILSQTEIDNDFNGQAVFYPLGDNVRVYASPDGKKEIFALNMSDPVIPKAERGDYYCIYDISTERAGWVLKNALDDNYYFQNDPVVDSLRDEISSWTDIKEICLTDGSIIGLKNDGSTVSARYKPYGVDVSNWGKLKSLGVTSEYIYGTPYDTSGVIQTLIYSTKEDNYQLYDIGLGVDYSVEKNELRYYTGGTKKIAEEAGVFDVLMQDGTLHTTFGTHMYDSVYTDWNYAFSQNGKWYFGVAYGSGDDNHIVYKDVDGKIDWDNGIAVTEGSKYDMSNVAADMVDVRAAYSHESFTALKSNGDIFLYGMHVGWLYDKGYTEDDGNDYVFNRDFTGLDMLVNEKIGVKDGKIVTMLKTKADGANYFSDKTYGPNLHTEVYSSWENIEYAYIDHCALIAVDHDSNVYVDVEDDWATSEYNCGQYDGAKDWKEKVVYIVSSGRSLLGVTEDGNVLISGLLPDEVA